MSCRKLVEVVPNFSEGSDMNIINQITDAIESISNIRLMDVDAGAATNRTVVTFIGEPDHVIEAAFQGIKKAAELIDMTKHKGEHPRMGATDVCPFVPISNVSMEECIDLARRLGERVGYELGISVYLYEDAALVPERRNLASCREGQYEGMSEKIQLSEWKPDFGPSILNERAGVTAIGARDFLVAYNINLNTISTRRANSVAFDIREAGRVLREGNPITGKPILDDQGKQMRIPGSLKACKAIGWFIEEYGIAQISVNLTDINVTSVHRCFDEANARATARGLRVTGSEIVGLVPLRVMLEAGKHYLARQGRSEGCSEEEIVFVAIKSLGLDDLKPFNPRKKIIEYLVADSDPTASRLQNMSLTSFCNETSSESMAPGGGSVAALVGALGASLATMVANLSANKPGWDDRVSEFSTWAVKGQVLKKRLLALVDDDTAAFNNVMTAYRMPKSNPEEISIRKDKIEAANKAAALTPLTVMRTAMDSFEVIRAMVNLGNPSSVTDAGVAALCVRAGIEGAYLNIKVNVGQISDATFKLKTMKEAESLLANADEEKSMIMAGVHALLDKKDE